MAPPTPTGRTCPKSCLHAGPVSWRQARTLLGSGALGGRGIRLALRRPRASVRGGRSGLMHMVHANARTTPAVRVEIARSREATGALAQRYGVSTETIRKWRRRGPEDC